MKKLFILPLLALGLLSCENFFMEHQLGYEPSITDQRNFSYTLTEADYETVAKNEHNINTAILLDEDDSTYYKALQEVGKNKYFTEKMSPDIYLPAFMASKYPYLSDGTLCEVTYNIEGELPFYLGDFDIVTTYTFAGYPDNLADIPDSIHKARPNVKAGTVAVVNLSSEETLVYVKNEAKTEADTDTAIWEPYQNGQIQVVALEQAIYTTLGTNYIENPLKTINTWLNLHAPYAKADDTYAVLYYKADNQWEASEFIYDGSKWNITSAVVPETMSFEMKDAWKANTSTYLSAPFIGQGIGKFVIQDVYLQSPLTYVWKYDSKYGMVASAYKGQSYDSESWLVSPAVKLKKAVQPQLIFDQAFNKAKNFTEEATVLVSTDYKGDVTTSNWTALEWNKNEDGSLNVPAGDSWIFQSSGAFDLSQWNGQTIYVAFRYKTSGGISGSWELQNVLIHEAGTEE